LTEDPECDAERNPGRPSVARKRPSTSRTLTEIRSLARSHTRTAINVLVGVMRSNDATPAARVSAANAILDRGWGKAPQSLENGEEGVLKLIHRIERIIVHPESPDSGTPAPALESHRAIDADAFIG
jgi:hypothetical protein